MLKKSLLLVTLLLVSACESYTADRYISTSTNQATLKAISSKKAASVAPFTVETAESINVTCRMAGPIQVAGAGKHEEYIQKAFIDELQNAGLYKPNASKKFSAVMKNVYVKTISPASWTIEGDFHVNGKFVKNVRTNFPYKTSYTAHSACNNAAENFPYAVEQFLGDFFNSTEFKRAL